MKTEAIEQEQQYNQQGEPESTAWERLEERAKVNPEAKMLYDTLKYYHDTADREGNESPTS